MCSERYIWAVLHLISLLATSTLIAQPAEDYSPITGAFAKIVKTIKQESKDAPVGFYRGTSLVGGVFNQNQKLTYTISPGVDGLMAAVDGEDGNDTEVTVDITSGGANAILDGKDGIHAFQVKAGKRYTISVTNKGGTTFVGLALFWVGDTNNVSHPVSGITKIAKQMASAIGQMEAQGFAIPVGRDSFQGGVLNSYPEHKTISRPLFNAKNWTTIAAGDGGANDISMRITDAKKEAYTTSSDSDVVKTCGGEDVIPGGAITISSPTKKKVLVGSIIMLKP